MKSFLEKAVKKPILLLLAVNLLTGVFIFRDYGLSWDEPYFYAYADSLGYAYSPREWFSGNFDLENSYGPSADDHRTRGPAYLFLARNFVDGLEALGSDSASAWHLVNFVFFQFGVYFLYRFSMRWMTSSAAFAAAAFFSYQPLLWGHAFINPKDPPFLVFFLASVCLGFEMADEISATKSIWNWKTIAAAFCLGIATSIRVLGPLAGLLVLAYAFLSLRRGLKSAATHTKPAKADLARSIALYAIIAVGVAILTWPYLWSNPISQFTEVFRFMSDNPTQLAVLFNGEIFRANDMPLRYIPFMLAATLTEPTWILFAIGLVIGIMKFYKSNPSQLASLLLALGWFVIIIAYILIQRPAVYDGVRHFLFMLPPIFVFSGFVFEWIIEGTSIWLRAGMILLVLLSGIVGIIQLHPYEYAYYNSLVGGTSGAFREYETEYWLTCYKEAVSQLDEQVDGPVNLFVLREGYVAAYYETPRIKIIDLRGKMDEVQPGDYVLVNTRTNDDRSIFRDAPPVVQIRHGDAIFCEMKRIP